MEANVTGTVHGNTIVLTSTPSGFEGQQVEVTIRPAPSERKWGEGILRSAGALADFPELDELMSQVRAHRKLDRPAPVEP